MNLGISGLHEEAALPNYQTCLADGMRNKSGTEIEPLKSFSIDDGSNKNFQLKFYFLNLFPL